MKLESAIAPDRRIWLGPPGGATPSGRALKSIMHKHLGAYGYLVDYDAALEVLEIAPATTMPIDHSLFDLGNSHIAYSLSADDDAGRSVICPMIPASVVSDS